MPTPGKSTANYKAQFERLIVLLTPGVGDLQRQHRVGQLLNLLHPREKREKYKSKALQGLADQILAEIPGIKLSAARLYSLREYGTGFTRQEVQELLQAATKNHTQLSWSHILYSLSIKSSQKRMKLLRYTIKQRWTAPDLMRWKLSRVESRKSDTTGRKLSVPPTLKQILEQIVEHTERWVKRCENVWLYEGEGEVEKKSPLMTNQEKSRAGQRTAKQDLIKRTQGLLKQMKTLVRQGRDYVI